MRIGKKGVMTAAAVTVEAEVAAVRVVMELQMLQASTT